jgi:SAM-dependent methyltransferase
MLEIGCASGAFLHRMAVSGWEVEGLDFSEEAAEAAQALGYPIHTSRLENSPDPEKPYDLVVGWHVFEHLHEPVLALQKLRRWTNPGAWLVLSMPDAGSWEFKIFKNRWYALQVPTHLFHYTPGTLRRILDRGGWRAERFFWHNNPNNLLQSLRYGCLDRGWNRPGDYLLDIALGRRHRAFHVFLGRFLGAFRLSGRMTIWAKHA